MPSVTVTSRVGKTTFDTPYTNQQDLFDRLADLVANEEIANPHATRLVNGYREYGSWKDYHFGWAAFHVAKHDTPQVFQQGNREKVQGLTPLVQHLTDATAHLKNPKILIVSNQEIEDASGFDEPLQVAFKLCGPKSKRKGCISVAHSTTFGDGNFYGYITPQGEWEPTAKASDELIALVTRVGLEPAKTIAELGRQSGTCCYCPAKLTQVQSKIAGAGKTCASNFNLPYPNAARTREILAECPEYLEGSTDRERWVGASPTAS